MPTPSLRDPTLPGEDTGPGLAKAGTCLRWAAGGQRAGSGQQAAGGQRAAGSGQQAAGSRQRAGPGARRRKHLLLK